MNYDPLIAEAQQELNTATELRQRALKAQDEALAQILRAEGKLEVLLKLKEREGTKRG